MLTNYSTFLIKLTGTIAQIFVWQGVLKSWRLSWVPYVPRSAAM